MRAKFYTILHFLLSCRPYLFPYHRAKMKPATPDKNVASIAKVLPVIYLSSFRYRKIAKTFKTNAEVTPSQAGPCSKMAATKRAALNICNHSAINLYMFLLIVHGGRQSPTEGIAPHGQNPCGGGSLFTQQVTVVAD